MLATIRESSFDPTRAISTTRTTDRESVSAAVVERWPLRRAFPGTDGLQVKFRVVRGLMPSGRNFVLRCARSRSQIVDRMRAPHAVAAKWRLLSRSTGDERRIAPSLWRVKLSRTATAGLYTLRRYRGTTDASTAARRRQLIEKVRIRGTASDQRWRRHAEEVAVSGTGEMSIRLRSDTRLSAARA